MYALSEEQFQIEASPSLRQVFAREDPYDRPFALGIEERRLLYPVYFDLRSMDIPLLDAIISAAREVEDTGFYLSITGRIVPPDPNRPYHWHFHFSELDKYESLGYVFALEHMLYSPNGQWGIMISHEDHALLGSSTTFCNAMHKLIPGFDDIKQIQDFLSIWKYYATERGVDISWIPGLLAHVYGAKTALRLLTEANLSELWLEPFESSDESSQMSKHA